MEAEREEKDGSQEILLSLEVSICSVQHLLDLRYFCGKMPFSPCLREGTTFVVGVAAT